MYLENINSPADLKGLSLPQLKGLCAEAREALVARLSARGGHCGPNFGMVEATVALHYVFNSPADRIVFDVSHQSYVHKMLTGRRHAFTDPAAFDAVSGYSEPAESEHDNFVIGHTSTAVSLACGLAKGRDLLGGSENVIAVLGDGSLSGGEAFEGLNNAAELGTNFIVLFNDNQMSIAENHGGMYAGLAELRRTGGQSPCNLFRALGLDYRYVADGNDLGALISALTEVRGIDHPVVVHINTVKGKGFAPAEADKETYHYCAPFDPVTLRPLAADDAPDYADLTADYLLARMKDDPSLVAITSGTPTVFGFTADRRAQAGPQFVDVGIAEEHAVALASGIATRGGHPVWGVYSTFVQRTYDQLSQDLCINDSPATILVFWASALTMNDVTHLCLFDIPLLSNIPNLVYLAPTCLDEYMAMLQWSIGYTGHPVAIRVPVGVPEHTGRTYVPCFDALDTFETVRRGSRAAIVAVGSMMPAAMRAAELLADYGIDATVINPRFVSGVDAQTLDALRADHTVVMTLEDGVLDGGFGEKIARFYAETDVRVVLRGHRKEFVDRYDRRSLMQANRLTPELIAADVARALAAR